MEKRGPKPKLWCKRGHYLPAHGYVASDGVRRCGECRRLTWREAKQKERQKAVNPMIDDIA